MPWSSKAEQGRARRAAQRLGWAHHDSTAPPGHHRVQRLAAAGREWRAAREKELGQARPYRAAGPRLLKETCKWPRQMAAGVGGMHPGLPCGRAQSPPSDVFRPSGPPARRGLTVRNAFECLRRAGRGQGWARPLCPRYTIRLQGSRARRVSRSSRGSASASCMHSRRARAEPLAPSRPTPDHIDVSQCSRGCVQEMPGIRTHGHLKAARPRIQSRVP